MQFWRISRNCLFCSHPINWGVKLISIFTWRTTQHLSQIQLYLPLDCHFCNHLKLCKYIGVFTMSQCGVNREKGKVVKQEIVVSVMTAIDLLRMMQQYEFVRQAVENSLPPRIHWSTIEGVKKDILACPFFARLLLLAAWKRHLLVVGIIPLRYH